MTVPSVAAGARRNVLLGQVVATLGGEAANRIAQLLTVALAGWMLGVSGLGLVGIAWSLTAMALALVQGGPELAGMRQLTLAGGDADGTARAIAEVTRLKLLLSAAVLPVLFSVLWLMGHDDETAMVQLAAQSCSMASSAWGYVWVFRGLHRPMEQAAIRVMQAVGTLALLWPLLMVWRSPLAVPVAEAVAALLAVAIARHRLGSLAKGTAASRRSLLSLAGASLRLGFAGLLSTLGWMAPILAAARWMTVEQVSYLTGILRLILGINGILQLGLQAFYPSLTRLYASDPAGGGEASVALAFQAGTVTAGAVVLMAGGAELLMPLILGPGFGDAAPHFRALLPILVPVALSAPFGYALIACGETAVFTRIAVVTTAAMALACLLAMAIWPTLWSVQLLHPILWGQAVATFLVSRRRKLVGWPGTGWLFLADPRTLGRLMGDKALHDGWHGSQGDDGPRRDRSRRHDDGAAPPAGCRRNAKLL